MDNNRSPRSREIVGPRPSPLKISKDSHKIIKKPPLVPQPQPQPLQEPPPRGPVIIYTESPKIIHIHPNNFMTLVQQLTGKTSTSTSSSSAPSTSTSTNVSSAARYAAMEKANTSNELGPVGSVETTMNQYYHHQHHAGILSPGPSSLPLISPDFFSTTDFSSILQTSPSTTQSPSSMDLFNNFFDS